ncbi:unnamed protein product [Polarella glacialis]|uniref:B30.2/SPRY domain-containing protein n=1 Tax=Polarella glacialis TaxID=89957 RepID=A0A813K3P9_POLGL|nr:unnamed protein product [Polarella glacialis]|mmetsp:Transcript_94479/g.170641  ORF Transcript_94479/g.170641 Transcript_94479/m.170641 type:complete len:587 (+) Transcript_94479:124-1884(+)
MTAGRNGALSSRKRGRRGPQAGQEEDEEEPEVGWSPQDADPEVWLEFDDSCGFYWGAGCPSTPSRAWNGVRGRPGILGGSYMFEIKVAGECDMVRVGWTPADSSRSVGSELHSYGFGGTGKKSIENRFADYGPPFGKGDIVGCLLNRTQRFVAFTLNGEFLGKSHTIPKEMDGVPLYPTVCAREGFKVAGYFGLNQAARGGLLFGQKGYWPIAAAEQEDRAEEGFSQGKRYRAIEAKAPTAIAPAVARTSAVSTVPSVDVIRKSTIIHIPKDLSRGGSLDWEVRKKGTTSERPLQGLSEDLERPYVRFTALPRPTDVRPVRVLQKSFDLVKERWAKDKDWVWAGEMLRSIRQDLTVQIVRSAFTVQVYEFCARAALKVGDFKQFDQCSTHLEELHGDTELKANENEPEFLAYRLLYLSLQGEGGLALSAFLRRRGGAIRREAAAGHPQLAPAWRLRAALSAGRLPKDLGSHFSSLALFAVLLDNARLRQLVAVCRAVKPGVSRALLSKLGIEADRPAKAVGPKAHEVTQGLPVKFCLRNNQLVDATATIAEAELRLASKAGQRIRLGHQSSDHARSFLRAVPPNYG